MTYVLVTILLVQVLSHFVPDLARLRRFDWFASWATWLSGRIDGESWRNGYTVLALIALPLLLIGVLQALLAQPLYGLPGFVFAVAVLFYSWGPRDLDRDVEAAASADVIDRPQVVRGVFGQGAPTSASAAAGLVGRAAQRRWFGPMLWFVILGPVGALLYRLADLGAHEGSDILSPEQQSVAARLQAILDWPVAALIGLGTAISTDFDTVFHAWRRRLAQTGGPFVFDSLLVPVVVAAGVKADLEEEGLAEDELGYADADLVLRDALNVVWRVLIVWMAILALVALVSLLA